MRRIDCTQLAENIRHGNVKHVLVTSRRICCAQESPHLPRCDLKRPELRSAATLYVPARGLAATDEGRL